MACLQLYSDSDSATLQLTLLGAHVVSKRGKCGLFSESLQTERMHAGGQLIPGTCTSSASRHSLYAVVFTLQRSRFC